MKTTTAPLFDDSKLRVILGSTERRGAWSVPRHLDVRVFLGSIEIDLREAHLAHGVTTIDVGVMLGSVKIIVLPDLAIEVGMLALAASVEETTGFQSPEPQRPIVRVIGDATLGSCEIVRRAA